MAYKCRICGTNDVEYSGDICELCAIGQDPYAVAIQRSSGINDEAEYRPQQTVDATSNVGTTYAPRRGKSRKVLLRGGVVVSNTDPYGNSIVPQQDDSVQVYQAGQAPANQPVVINSSDTGAGNAKVANKNEPLTTGITKNIFVDNQNKSFIKKLFRTLTQGVPYTFDDDVTMFQVFPDYSGTSLNAMGNACDQVVVYGKLNNGTVSENNEVEVYGRRDSNNNIIAKEIYNKATGTTIVPEGTFPAVAVWGIIIAVFLGVCFLAMSVSGSVGDAAAGISAGLTNFGAWLWTAFVTTTVFWAVIMYFARNKLRGKSKLYLYIGMFVLILMLRMT